MNLDGRIVKRSFVKFYTLMARSYFPLKGSRRVKAGHSGPKLDARRFICKLARARACERARFLCSSARACVRARAWPRAAAGAQGKKVRARSRAARGEAGRACPWAAVAMCLSAATWEVKSLSSLLVW